MAETDTAHRGSNAFHVADALRIVWRAAPGWTAVNVAVALVQGLLPVASVYLTKLIIDAATQGIGASDPGAAFRRTATYIAAAALVGLTAAGLRSVGSVASEALGHTVTDHVTDLIHEKSIVVDLEYYENARYYDILHRAQQEAPFRPARIVSNLLLTGQSLVSLLAMAGVLFTLQWAIGLVMVMAALPVAVVRVRYSRRLFEWQVRRTSSERRAWYLHQLIADGVYAKEVRLLGIGGLLIAEFRDLQAILRGERIGLAARRSVADFLASAASVLAVFGTFAYIVWRTIIGAITVGSMVMYYQAFQTGLASLQSVLGGLAGLYEDGLFLTSYHEFMRLDSRVPAPTAPLPLPRPLTSGLVLEDVNFAYPDSQRTALEHVSLLIPPGQVTALVGPNGSGKTTLVKLLCRFYDPTQGRIMMDGVDLRDLDINALRSAYSVILQDFGHYHMTARENIWVGDISRDRDDPAIARASRDSGVEETLLALPRGYDTMLGRLFDEGEELSAGEWQKVALARAFLRDAQVLIFDEPTSALDPESEEQVFNRIRTLAQGRTIILISHRFSTVRSADMIHILDSGRVLESGTHEELVAEGGRYAHMYRVQAKAYENNPAASAI